VSDPLRIAMLGTRGMPTTYGGVERAVEELSVRLAARGHDVTVYCRSQYCESREPVVRGVNLRYLPALDTKHLEAISHTALATVDAAARRFDVIHYHALGPSLLAPVARLSAARVVTTVQGLDYERAKWGAVASTVLRLGAWSAARCSHRTICVSRVLERRFSERYGARAVYAPNGVSQPGPVVDAPPFGLEPRGYFLFLGRLVPEKAVHLLIDAYRRSSIPLPLVIAGPSSHSDAYVDRLRAQAAGDDRVRLVGPVYGEAKDALLAHALAFCQPSDLEGLPISLLESMSHGRPAVVSDLPEHLEVIGDGGGFPFRRGDADDLLRTLERVFTERDAVERAGAQAREIVRRDYDWETIADRVEEVYDSIRPRGKRRGVVAS
jgi:glycosyltransferase involved in cell wall biosynthesis